MIELVRKSAIRHGLSVTVSVFAIAFFIRGLDHATTFGADSIPETLERDFSEMVLPFLQNHCLACHGSKKQEGKLDLSDNLSLAAVVRNHRVWEHVVERLVAEEMPPPSESKQPSAELRKAVIAWSRTLSDYEARRNAGDPGTVLARRLSNAEFDNTIRDLTGRDIRPTKEFPVDPANEAGFDNSGESLTMSPALVKKYLAAARSVADHLVLTPAGIVFAPDAAVTETDRDKFCVHQIVDFYNQHEVDYADYFFAAWQFQHRERLGRPHAALSDFATAPGKPLSQEPSASQKHERRIDDDSIIPGSKASALSAKYLETIWTALSTPEEVGPLAELQNEWKHVSSLFDGQPLINDPSTPTAAPAPDWRPEVRRGCEKLRELVLALRKGLDPKIDKLHLKGGSDGSQPLVLWWNRRIAAARRNYVGDGQDTALDAARRRFCRVFPNQFAVTSRGHYADPNLGVNVRLLTAGFHLMQGYFRDDEPLCELVLDQSDKAELDLLWQTLNLVTLVPIRQYKDFLFFERAEPPQFADEPEFDFARPENKDVTSQSKLGRMRDLYLKKARKKNASPQVIEAIETYFATMSADVRWIERTQIEAQPTHLKALVQFAERAFRRPLSSEDRNDLLKFYHSLRDNEGLSHEEAVRDSIASVLLSPQFCYRFDLASPGDAVRPLSDNELASRLSYFLWSSMPDRELLSPSERGNLREPAVLMTHARRMLRDQRIRGLASEFAGNWLDFRRFEEHNSVDRERFPSFTNELRQAMFEEPLQFFINVASHNRSVLDFLDADYIYVNPLLAKHYGMNIEHLGASDDGWVQVDRANEFGRGGLLAMSVFLTKNSPGLRTSPVKRGYWVVRRLLGEHIPPPPPDVPELPKDEASLGELSLPQLLARHRDHKACAGCHQRFDSIGLVFEGFGPIGERRDRDLGDRPIEIKAQFPDGAERTGVDGLRRYLIETRRDEFVNNLCRKLFSYALGRSLILSDNPTIEQMQAKLAADGYRFESLIESIITSPQFLQKRGMD